MKNETTEQEHKRRGASELTRLLCGDTLEERLFKAVLIIEQIAAENEHLPKELNTKKKKELHGAINTIYKIAHVSRLPNCMNVHDDWEKSFNEVIKMFSVDEVELPAV